MTHPDARLDRLLGGPALASLRQRLRRQFERQGEGTVAPMLQLSQLSATEHEALALLTGRPARPTRSVRIDVAQLDQSLQAAGIAGSLREALERLDGPIVNHSAQRAEAEAAWSGMAGLARRDARLQAWAQTPEAGSLLKRLARQDAVAADALLVQADAVLRQLPAIGLTRAQVAAQTLGNAHALDAGQPAASVVLAAWRFAEASALSGAVADDAETPAADERPRDVWARAGILVNELARPVLVLNLPILASTRASWTTGEPAYLSLRQLLRTPPVWAVGGQAVFVCENPNLLAIAADRLGALCAPLVCTDGMPAAAQRTLLTQLADAGARLRYHGDFDWPGIQIANHVMRTWSAEPWRLTEGDYEAAAQAAPHAQRNLPDAGVEATWDPQLAPAMRRHGLAIAEEALAEGLIGDLRTGPPTEPFGNRV